MSQLREHCDTLVDLIHRYRETGGNPREFLPEPPEPILLFYIDVPATVQTGETVYRPTQTYRELCAALRKGIEDRTKRARSMPRRSKRS